MDNKPAINGSNMQMPLILYGLNILIMNKAIHAIVKKKKKNGEYLTTFTTWLDTSTLVNTIPNEEGIISNTKTIVKNTSNKITIAVLFLLLFP